MVKHILLTSFICIYIYKASHQFLVLIRDFKDSEALNRRLLVRDLHLKEANKVVESGELLCGGAVLDSHKVII